MLHDKFTTSAIALSTVRPVHPMENLMNTRFGSLALLAAVLACDTAEADVSSDWRRLAGIEIQRTAAGAKREGLIGKVDEAIARARAAANASSANDSRGSASDREDAAVAVAVLAVVEYLVPESREELEARLAITFSRIPETDAKALGAAFGRAVAAEVLANVGR